MLETRTTALLAAQHASRTATNPHRDTPSTFGAIADPGATAAGQLLYWTGSVWDILPGVRWNLSGGIYTIDVSTAGATPADLKLDCGTEKTLEFVQPVYTDVDFPIIIRTTGPGIPTLTTINGNLQMPQWQVNDVNMCESQEFPHSWEEGTICTWHIHLTTNGSDVGDTYVRFELEYGYCTPNGTWSWASTVDSGDLLIAGGTADQTMKILSLGNFTPTGVAIGGHAVARLKRIASSGTAPTSDPWIPMLQMHIRNNTLGSRKITSK